MSLSATVPQQCIDTVPVCPILVMACKHATIHTAGTAEEDPYLSDDSVDPDDMSYEVQLPTAHQAAQAQQQKC